VTRFYLVLFGLIALVFVPALADSEPDAKPPASKEAEPGKDGEGEEKKKPIARTGPKDLFPVRVDLPGAKKLHLNGWALCKWGLFNWDLYYIALHVEQTSKVGKTLLAKDQAYQVHLHFVRDLTQAQMRKAYTAGIETNAGDDLPKFKKRLKKLLSLLRAVEEGDDLRFLYLPGEGMTVSFGGKPAGTIEGADWARLFLDMYVGKNSPTEGLRKGLLGG